MARISSYQLDQVITDNDFVVGSDAVTRITKNYRIADLAEYFSQNISIDDTLYSIPDMSTKIDNIQDMFTYTNILEDITGFSTAMLTFLNTAFDDRLETKSTDDLDEGSTNLYFTTERAQDAIGDILTDGTGITITYNDANNTIEIGSTITQYTDTLAREAIDVTDNGGYGELSYDENTGVIEYTGPSTEDIRGEFTAGTGVTITDGEISVDTSVVESDKHESLSFTTGTFGSPVNEETFDGVTYNYIDFAHNLAKYPAVTVIEESNPDRVCFVPVKYVDNNTVRVYFRGTTSGTVYVN